MEEAQEQSVGALATKDVIIVREGQPCFLRCLRISFLCTFIQSAFRTLHMGYNQEAYDVNCAASCR